MTKAKQKRLMRIKLALASAKDLWDSLETLTYEVKKDGGEGEALLFNCTLCAVDQTINLLKFIESFYEAEEE